MDGVCHVTRPFFRYCCALAALLSVTLAAPGSDVGGRPEAGPPQHQCPDDGCAAVQCPGRDHHACPLGLVPDECACCPYGLCGLGETVACNAIDRPCADNLECVSKTVQSQHYNMNYYYRMLIVIGVCIQEQFSLFTTNQFTFLGSGGF